MGRGKQDAQNELAALRQAFAERLSVKVGEIQSWCTRLREGSDFRQVLERLHQASHSLVGSAGTFGFSGVSAQARTLEQHTLELLDRSREPDPAQIADLEAEAEELAALADESVGPTAVRQASAERPAKSCMQPARPLRKPPDRRLIYLVEEDAAVRDELVLQIGHFGYTVRAFREVGELKGVIQTRPPAAVVVDTGPGKELSRELSVLQPASHEDGTSFALIVISSCGDLRSRLQAVRAGAVDYFLKPVDVGVLVDRLDALASAGDSEPYRILVVDDEPDVARHHALVLRDAGLEVEVVTQPMTALNAVAEYKPELILMDLYMPECTGLELARVIRQQEAYLSMPIVYLSAETNMEKQFDALRFGGDDFLTKPIHDDYLISSVIARAQRFRLLSSMMIRDSLTGLLKHTKVKEELQLEVLRARRQGIAMSFAMIDLDRFKSVNDVYGHLSGDRVLKSLARLLQQRLRKTDVIGRYGGEEFAVVFPGTKDATASEVLDQIRSDFSGIRHFHCQKEFSVSFSAGVAGFPRYRDENTLIQAADAALYNAKERGRNRVVNARD